MSADLDGSGHRGTLIRGWERHKNLPVEQESIRSRQVWTVDQVGWLCVWCSVPGPTTRCAACVTASNPCVSISSAFDCSSLLCGDYRRSAHVGSVRENVSAGFIVTALSDARCELGCHGSATEVASLMLHRSTSR